MTPASDVNILYLAQVLPYPLDAGPKIRMHYVLRYLAQSHRVTLVAFIRAGEEKYLPELERLCHAVHVVPMRRSRARDAAHFARSLVSGEPFLIARDSVRAMYDKVAELTARERFDFLHADQLNMAQFAPQVDGSARVLDAHNAVWTIVRRSAENETSFGKRRAMELEWHKLRRYEARTIRRFDHVITVTPQDRDALLSYRDPALGELRSPIQVIPICIDTTEFKAIRREPNARDIVCVGGMFYPPNVDGMIWFCEQVLPLVLKEQPETRFFIVGARPDARLVELARQNPHIVVTGYVEDPTPYLALSAAYVVPLRAGGGMRVKILQAWASGVPIVTTTVGCEGILATDGENLLIADDAPAFARAVLRLITNRALGERLAQAGVRWVAEQYEWRKVYRAFDRLYPPASSTA